MEPRHLAVRQSLTRCRLLVRLTSFPQLRNDIWTPAILQRELERDVPWHHQRAANISHRFPRRSRARRHHQRLPYSRPPGANLAFFAVSFGFNPQPHRVSAVSVPKMTSPKVRGYPLVVPCDMPPIVYFVTLLFPLQCARSLFLPASTGTRSCVARSSLILYRPSRLSWLAVPLCFLREQLEGCALFMLLAFCQ